MCFIFYVFDFYYFYIFDLKMKITSTKSILHNKILNQIKLNTFSGKTYIYACVKNKNTTQSNDFLQLNCKNLQPITSHIFDISTNTISVYGVEIKLLGSVNFVLKMKINNSSMNSINLPIPNNLIYSLLNLDGKNKYNEIKEKYKEKGLYKINFLQLIKL